MAKLRNPFAFLKDERKEILQSDIFFATVYLILEQIKTLKAE